MSRGLGRLQRKALESITNWSANHPDDYRRHPTAARVAYDILPGIPTPSQIGSVRRATQGLAARGLVVRFHGTYMTPEQYEAWLNSPKRKSLAEYAAQDRAIRRGE